MKKMIIALLVLVGCLTMGYVHLDGLVKDYAIQKQEEDYKVLKDLEADGSLIDHIAILEVEKEGPLSYSYAVEFRQWYKGQWCEAVGTVNVIDMIRSNL